MDRDFLIDLFADFGPVAIRRMFSGYGISADGITSRWRCAAGFIFVPMKRAFRGSRLKGQCRFRIKPAPRPSR
jgi:DNA transformation protein and related proteins